MFAQLGRNNLLLMIALFVWAFGEGVWFNLRQLYLADLGASAVQVGAALAVENIARALLLIPAGYLSDRFGPYRMVVASWVMGIAGPLMLIPAQAWQWAVPGLAVYAMSAFAIPTVSAYTLLNLPNRSQPELNQRALTAIYASYAAGLIFSPWLGGWIADAAGIRATLWIGAGLFTLSLLVLLIAKHVPPAETVHNERPRDLFKNRNFITLALFFSTAALVYLVAIQLVPNFLQEVRGFSLSSIGLLFSLMSAGTVAFNLIAGRTDRQWSYALVLIVLWLSTWTVWMAMDVPAASIAFFGLGALWTARTLGAAGIAAVVSPRNRGLAFGITDTLIALTAAAASASAGALYDLTPAHDLPFIATLAGLPVMLLVWFGVRPALKPQPLNPPLPAGEEG